LDTTKVPKFTADPWSEMPFKVVDNMQPGCMHRIDARECSIHATGADRLGAQAAVSRRVIGAYFINCYSANQARSV